MLFRSETFISGNIYTSGTPYYYSSDSFINCEFMCAVDASTIGSTISTIPVGINDTAQIPANPITIIDDIIVPRR